MQLTLYARIEDCDKIRAELENKLASENLAYLFNGIGKAIEKKPEILFLWQISSCNPYFSFTKNEKEVYRTKEISELIEFVKLTFEQGKK